jgi:hypothetical protein
MPEDRGRILPGIVDIHCQGLTALQPRKTNTEIFMFMRNSKNRIFALIINVIFIFVKVIVLFQMFVIEFSVESVHYVLKIV